MAGPCVQRSSRQNLLFASKDKLAKAAPRAPTNNKYIFSHTSTMLCVSTPAPATPFDPAKLVAKYTNADLQRATKLALKLFVQGQ